MGLFVSSVKRRVIWPRRVLTIPKDFIPREGAVYFVVVSNTSKETARGKYRRISNREFEWRRSLVPGTLRMNLFSKKVSLGGRTKIWRKRRKFFEKKKKKKKKKK